MRDFRLERLVEFFSNLSASKAFIAPMQPIDGLIGDGTSQRDRRINANISVYLASPMFNAVNPEDDRSSSNINQLAVEEAILKALQQSGVRFNQIAKQQQSKVINGTHITFNFVPLIPRKFEQMEWATSEKVVENDLRAINSSKLFIVNHCEGPSVGTSMETYHAKRLAKIPVVTIIRPDQNVSVWMRQHTDYFVINSDIESVLPAIIENEFGHLA